MREPELLTPDQVRHARHEVGALWGLGRPLTCAEMAEHLGLRTKMAVVDMEREHGRSRITGPVSVAIRAFLAGYVPATAPESARRAA